MNIQYKISFQNDVVFKYIFVGDDDHTQILRNYVIQAITGIDVVSSVVINPEIIPDSVENYAMRVDVLVYTEDGSVVNLEMQQFAYGGNAMAKSEAYLSALHGRQAKGIEPRSFHQTHQLLFANRHANTVRVLISHMRYQDELGNTYGDKVWSHHIYLPYINQIAKEKGLENLSTMELIIYIFHNGVTHGILNMRERPKEVEILMEKYEAFSQEERLVLLAMQRDYKRQLEAAHIQDALVQGTSIGEERMVQLMRCLQADGRLDVLGACLEDKELRKQLYLEYHIA